MLPTKISRWTTDKSKVSWTRRPALVDTPMSYPRLAELTEAQKQKSSVARVTLRVKGSVPASFGGGGWW
jgi:hypothetical protein